MTDADWLRSRRAEAYERAKHAVAANDVAEAERLERLIKSFDMLLARHRGLNYKPSEVAHRSRERLRRMRAAVTNAERRRFGLNDPPLDEEVELPPPELPLPVREVDEEQVANAGDHMIADDVAKRAATMMSYGYSFGRRRSRRYEGLR